MGIDPGNSATGYAVVESQNNRLKALTWGVIRPLANIAYSARMKYIYDNLSSVIEEFSPDEVAIEELFMAENAKSAIKLGQVRGVAIVAAANKGKSVAEYTPLYVKKSVVGYGRASKEQVREMVIRIVSSKQENIPFDASDAMAIAICHSNSASFQQKIDKRSKKIDQ